MIDELYAALLAAGVDVGPEELSEILWLAAQIAPDVPRRTNASEALLQFSGTTPLIPLPEMIHTVGSVPRHYFNTEAEERSSHEFEGPAAQLALVRRAPALDDPLEVMRALRPLGRRALSNGGVAELDEEQTVITSVEQRMVVPVFKPQKGRWLDLALVIDTNHSMLLWSDLIDELRRAITVTGIFRDVRVWYLNHADGQEPHTVSRSMRGEPRPPQEVADPAGHQLVLIVSDIVAKDWKSQNLASIARQWASHGPLAVLNVLAPRLWTRCAAHPVGALVRPPYPAAPNTSWRLTPPPGGRRRSTYLPRFRDKLAIPVLEVSPAGINTLATIVAGTGEWNRVPCLILDRDPSPSEQLITEDHSSEIERDPKIALRKFQENSSPAAQELAGYLSAVPLTLPVMALVRRAMMPRSEHSHLAEVALGGLFEPWRRIQSIIDIDRFEFQFLPGVREALLGAQLREDITAVQEIVRRQVAEFIERSSVAARTFQAMKTTSKSNKELRIKEGAIPFAETHLEHQSDSSVISLNTQDGDGLAVSDRDEQVVSQKRRVLVRQYRLDHLLSTDSRGEKWKAYDINTRRHVSVSIHSSYGRSSDNIAARWQSLVQRYQQACEAQPQHLEKVYDIGSDDEIVYIVAKLEDGIPMSDLSRNRGILGMEFAKALAFQLDSALSALHESGLAHGNISPENVLIDSTGIAKLRNWSPAAWGAAVRPDDSSSLRYDWQSSQYSPPEAGQSQPDRNSDLFSLGCVIFAALAGQPPYAADFGSLADLPPNVSRVLRRVVLGLIALDPSTRESGARSLVKLKASMSERMGRRTTEPSRQQPESREVQEQQDETNTAPEYIASIPTPYEDGDLQLLRPYAMTGGRTRSRYHLSIESLVTTTPRQDQFVGLLPEHARICYLCLETKSVAEISAILSIPLGVARILVADLSEAGYVSVNDPNAAAKGTDEEIRLLNEVRDRLEDI